MQSRVGERETIASLIFVHRYGQVVKCIVGATAAIEFALRARDC